MLITSKFESWCNRCGKVRIRVGDRCEWAPPAKGVTCLTCLGTSPPAQLPRQPTKVIRPSTRDDDELSAVFAAPVLPPALAALDALETQFVRMAAKTASPAIDSAWTRYEKIKALGIGNRIAPEQRVALCTALVVLVKALFAEESAYVV